MVKHSKKILQALHHKKRTFLNHYKTLFTISKACEATGITRTTYYRWLEESEQFKAEFEDARKYVTEMLEAEAIRRAYQGVDEPVFYKGDEVARVQKYSDTLLIFLLKANNPDKYRDNSSVDITSKGERIGYDNLTSLTDEQLEYIAARSSAGAAKKAEGEAKSS